MKKIVIIGSTGSIGTQALKLIERHKDKFEVVGLVANANAELLSLQRKKFGVKCCGLFSHNGNVASDILRGEECYKIASLSEADIVLIASSGFSALPYVIEAINSGKQIAIANKETLVSAGELIMPLVKEKNIIFHPVDSEHSAIWQSMQSGQHKDIKRLILTASGGSFRDYTLEQMKNVTVEQTLNHPNWNMGRKITVDSATMMNKGLEVIEAKWLFDMSVDDIDVTVHRQSIVHSMVEFADNAVIAEMSYPTMEIPIQLAFTYPNRADVEVPSMDFSKLMTLSFEPLDEVRFPAVKLAKEVSKMGGMYPTVMNIANEVMVERFLNGEINFLDIVNKVEKTLELYNENVAMTLENIMYINEKYSKISRTI